MGNKNIEKDCIDKALKYSKSQHGKSKKIINLLIKKDIYIMLHVQEVNIT